MPLLVEDVKLEDFDTMEKYSYHEGGDFVTPLVALLWPISNPQEAADRNKWSLSQQCDMCRLDPTAKFVKVVDTDKGNEIISVARWHFYPNGIKADTTRAVEVTGAADPSLDASWPAGLNSKTYMDLFFASLGKPKWMGTQPLWTLTTLVTRSCHQRRGAGGMLVQWGVSQAKKDHVSAYLDATLQGYPLYQKYGFKHVGDWKIDLTPFGGKGEAVMAQMKYTPE